MTDLERKLAEALRGQAEEVTPNLDAAWAEQMRRQRRPHRRRATVWLAPLAAVLVVLTSVSVATRVPTPSDQPVQPALPGQPLVLAKPELPDRTTLSEADKPVTLTDFTGQTDTWTSYAAEFFDPTGRALFCVEALPKGANHGAESQFGIKSPSCLPLSETVVRTGYVGENGGPLPAGKAVYLVDRKVHALRLYSAAGDLSLAKPVGPLGWDTVFFATIDPNSPPVRFEVS
ncbi:hypothetical protein OG738_11865 [Amycolatopsis sp. NBC_01488]|uniref:hypothetical protein n=1 Tax=Amycolatopsis sp. NBC_01488 TaxID=2903563 RepID=UPI002E2DDDE0|nr:hypothetical protein [Amycolatopsis sp. NBC_01488]